MKKNKLLLIIVTLVFAFSSCEKERTFPEFEDLEYGSLPRLYEGVDGLYDFFDIDGSEINFSVEFYDEANGSMVESYSWTVEYSGNGGVGPVDLLTVNKTEFGTSPDGLPSASFTFGFRDILNALSLTEADIEGGQFFTFLSTLTRSDGKVFTRDNAGLNIKGQPAFQGMFEHRQSIVCPSELQGVLDYSTVPWCGAPVTTGQVEWIKEGNSSYQVMSLVRAGEEDFAYGAYYPCYGDAATLPGGNLRVEDACGVLSTSGVSRWGEVYTYNSITVSGNQLTMDWVNDYGEGGVTTLTRTDGQDWPPSLTN